MTKIDPKIHDVIGEWLILLGNGCTGKMSQEDARVKVQLYTTMLAAEFPTSAFTQKSLAHVLKQCTFFPSYSEVARSLKAFLVPAIESMNLPLRPMPLPAFTVINMARPASSDMPPQGPSQADQDSVAASIAEFHSDIAKNHVQAAAKRETPASAPLKPHHLAQVRRDAGIVVRTIATPELEEEF
jgi:hypothetical protein